MTKREDTAIEEAAHWLLQLASEHGTSNVISPLVILYLSDPIAMVQATLQTETFRELLPEIVAKGLFPRRDIIDAFREARSQQSEEETNQARGGLDCVEAAICARKSAMRQRSENPSRFEHWLDNSGITPETALRSLLKAGTITIDSLDELAPSPEDPQKPEGIDF